MITCFGLFCCRWRWMFFASTAEDDGKIKKGSVNISSCYLSLPPALLPLNIQLTPIFSSEPCGDCVIYGLCDIELYLTLSLFTSLFFGSEFSSSQQLLRTCDRSNWAKALCEMIQNLPLVGGNRNNKVIKPTGCPSPPLNKTGLTTFTDWFHVFIHINWYDWKKKPSHICLQWEKTQSAFIFR